MEIASIFGPASAKKGGKSDVVLECCGHLSVLGTIFITSCGSSSSSAVMSHRIADDVEMSE